MYFYLLVFPSNIQQPSSFTNTQGRPDFCQPLQSEEAAFFFLSFFDLAVMAVSSLPCHACCETDLCHRYTSL